MHHGIKYSGLLVHSLFFRVKKVKLLRMRVAPRYTDLTTVWGSLWSQRRLKMHQRNRGKADALLLWTCLQDILLSSPPHRCVRCPFKCRKPTSLQKSSCSPSASEAWDHKRHVVLLCPGLASHENTAQFVLFFNTRGYPLHNRAFGGFIRNPC